jgi:hypothetical protein
MSNPEVAVGQKWRDRDPRYKGGRVVAITYVNESVVGYHRIGTAATGRGYPGQNRPRDRFLRAFELIEEKKP